MKSIPVTDFTPVSGGEYIAVSYPGNGVYLTNTGLLVIVHSSCVYGVPGGGSLVGAPTGGSMVGAPTGDAKGDNPSGLSESFILKALAIAQNPQLAVDLTR